MTKGILGRVGWALGVLASVAGVAASPTRADDLALRDAASFAGVEMFLNSRAPGLVLAVVAGDESVVLGYGETAPGNGIEPDGRSIVRIGSLSKVFTGDLLASMAAAGKVGLDDPLSRYAPKDIAIPSFGGRPITLLDLVTHSAGLPREVSDPAGPDPDGNPYSVFRTAYLWQWLAGHPPAYRPGTTSIYSNAGFGLLGEALATAGEKPYPNLLADRITGPLGMADTVVTLSDAQKPRLMVGLDLFGKPDPNWPNTPIMAASGGIYSTADDMVRWMRWHLSDDASGQPARTLAHALWRPNDGLSRLVGVEVTDSLGMGLGWVVSPPHDGVPLLLGKSGGMGGFMSYVVLAPNRRLGIFVSASRIDFAMFEGLQQTVRTLAAELVSAGR